MLWCPSTIGMITIFVYLWLHPNSAQNLCCGVLIQSVGCLRSQVIVDVVVSSISSRHSLGKKNLHKDVSFRVFCSNWQSIWHTANQTTCSFRNFLCWCVYICHLWEIIYHHYINWCILSKQWGLSIKNGQHRYHFTLSQKSESHQRSRSHFTTHMMVLFRKWVNELGAKWPKYKTNFQGTFAKWLQEKA